MEKRWIVIVGSTIISFLLGVLLCLSFSGKAPEKIYIEVEKNVSIPCEEVMERASFAPVGVKKVILKSTEKPVLQEASKTEPSEKEAMTVLASTQDEKSRFLIEIVSPQKVTVKKLKTPIVITGTLETTDVQNPFTLTLRQDILGGEFPVMMRIKSFKEDMTMMEEVYCFQSIREGYYYDMRILLDGYINCMIEKEYKRPTFGGEPTFENLSKGNLERN